MDNVDRLLILRSAVKDMAQFIRDNPPATIPEVTSMSIKDFCRCFADSDADPTGEKIVEYFITKSYNEYTKRKRDK